jgi:predicted amidohydrolase YtcJ
MQDQRLSAREAVDGYTAWPAYASFEDTRKGTLAPGMLADIAVLSGDILSDPVAADVVVEATVFDGKVVYQRGAKARSDVMASAGRRR